MNLQVMLDEQKKMQARLGNPMGDGHECIKENFIALIVEATEILNEIPWKPWRANINHHVDRNKVAEEMADLMRFYLNIMNEIGIDEAEFETAWYKTERKVLWRHCNEK